MKLLLRNEAFYLTTTAVPVDQSTERVKSAILNDKATNKSFKRKKKCKVPVETKIRVKTKTLNFH